MGFDLVLVLLLVGVMVLSKLLFLGDLSNGF